MHLAGRVRRAVDEEERRVVFVCRDRRLVGVDRLPEAVDTSLDLVGGVLVGDVGVVHTVRSVRSHIKTVVRQSVCRVGPATVRRGDTVRVANRLDSYLSSCN